MPLPIFVATSYQNRRLPTYIFSLATVYWAVRYEISITFHQPTIAKFASRHKQGSRSRRRPLVISHSLQPSPIEHKPPSKLPIRVFAPSHSLATCVEVSNWSSVSQSHGCVELNEMVQYSYGSRLMPSFNLHTEWKWYSEPSSTVWP